MCGKNKRRSEDLTRCTDRMLSTRSIVTYPMLHDEIYRTVDRAAAKAVKAVKAVKINKNDVSFFFEIDKLRMRMIAYH